MISEVLSLNLLCDDRAPPFLGAVDRDARKIATRMPVVRDGSRTNSSEAAGAADRLVAVAQCGDHAAFAAVFEYFAPRIKSYLLRSGSDATMAEEVMQETMFTVWRKAGHFDPSKGSASTWVFTIARNLRIDAFRRDRRPEFDPDDPALTLESDPPVDQAIVQQQSAAHLKEALTILSCDEQMLLKLAFYDDLSHSAISKKLGVPLGTVKSRIRLAFAKLRTALGDRFGDSE
jgi:RNA polymerase sigma factor (sigma-70 family)